MKKSMKPEIVKKKFTTFVWYRHSDAAEDESVAAVPLICRTVLAERNMTNILSYILRHHHILTI